jgi:hypothetical protein
VLYAKYVWSRGHSESTRQQRVERLRYQCRVKGYVELKGVESRRGEAGCCTVDIEVMEGMDHDDVIPGVPNVQGVHR